MHPTLHVTSVLPHVSLYLMAKGQSHYWIYALKTQSKLIFPKTFLTFYPPSLNPIHAKLIISSFMSWLWNFFQISYDNYCTFYILFSDSDHGSFIHSANVEGFFLCLGCCARCWGCNSDPKCLSSQNLGP